MSHEEKRALQGLARRKGQTVSAMVREVLAGHLSAALGAQPQPSIQDRTRMIFRTVTTHPRKLAAALLASGGLTLAFLPAATAEPLTLALEGSIASKGDDAQSTHRFRTTVELEPGTPGTIVIQEPGSEEGLYRIEFTASPDESGAILVDLNIFRGDSDELLAHPRFLAAPGEEARAMMESGSESYDIAARVTPG